MSAIRVILGAVAGLFAAMLLGLPLWRFTRGRMPFTEAMGFWVAGAGFAVLAAAAFTGEPAVAQLMVLVGVILAAAGSVVQRMLGD